MIYLASFWGRGTITLCQNNQLVSHHFYHFPVINSKKFYENRIITMFLQLLVTIITAIMSHHYIFTTKKPNLRHIRIETPTQYS